MTMASGIFGALQRFHKKTVAEISLKAAAVVPTAMMGGMAVGDDGRYLRPTAVLF
jgi:hypothetical protein